MAKAANAAERSTTEGSARPAVVPKLNMKVTGEAISVVSPVLHETLIFCQRIRQMAVKHILANFVYCQGITLNTMPSDIIRASYCGRDIRGLGDWSKFVGIN